MTDWVVICFDYRCGSVDHNEVSTKCKKVVPVGCGELVCLISKINVSYIISC